jgi:preprotein translocase subunit SecG
MATVSVILSIISVIAAILLTLVILIQNPKHGGGIGAIGGGVSEAMFGASAPTALVKVTVVLAIIFLFCTLANTAIVGKMSRAKSVGAQLAAEAAATENTAAPIVSEEAAEVATEATKAATEAAEAPVAPAEK